MIALNRSTTDALLQVIWVSMVAGVGVPSCYGLAILGYDAGSRVRAERPAAWRPPPSPSSAVPRRSPW